MTSIIVFDTSVLVDHLRTGRHQRRFDSITGLIRTSSVVLAELWRGATTISDKEFLRALERNHPILTPTQKNWIDSGQILGKIHADKKLAAHSLRDLHFDVLIALTARSYRARVVTSNRADFELIRHYRKFDLEIW